MRRVVSGVNLQSNDFELFDLVPRLEQDRAAIDARWKVLQREVHPDRFATQDAALQRVAMQWSVRINEAYQRLKDPLKRAAYLCELNAVPVNAQDNTSMPAEFLMQQMQWREALEEAQSAAELDKLSAQVLSAKREALGECGRLLDDCKDYQQAVQKVRALMFIERFESDINIRIDQLDAVERRQ
jgi:molecular chaperone HscB